MAKPLNPETPTTVLNFRLSNDEIARLDRLAARTGITRAHFLRNIVVTGLEEFEIMESVGIVGPLLRSVILSAGWVTRQKKLLLSRRKTKNKFHCR